MKRWIMAVDLSCFPLFSVHFQSFIQCDLSVLDLWLVLVMYRGLQLNSSTEAGWIEKKSPKTIPIFSGGTHRINERAMRWVPTASLVQHTSQWK